MSDTEKTTKKSSKKDKPGQLRDWIIRGVVFGVLGVLLVMALLDFRTKQAATSTAAAWRAALRAKGENGDLGKSEFEKISVQGSPTIVTTKAETRTIHGVMFNTYTWKGTFRTYVVKVGFGMGKDSPVEQIEGPGDAQ